MGNHEISDKNMIIGSTYDRNDRNDKLHQPILLITEPKQCSRHKRDSLTPPYFSQNSGKSILMKNALTA